MGNPSEHPCQPLQNTSILPLLLGLTQYNSMGLHFGMDDRLFFQKKTCLCFIVWTISYICPLHKWGSFLSQSLALPCYSSHKQSFIGPLALVKLFENNNFPLSCFRPVTRPPSLDQQLQRTLVGFLWRCQVLPGSQETPGTLKTVQEETSKHLTNK